MNSLQLLQMAIASGARDFPNEIVCIFYNSKINEYTIVPEKGASKILEIEPGLTLINKYLNGEKVN